jgi:hypothetical protein
MSLPARGNSLKPSIVSSKNSTSLKEPFTSKHFRLKDSSLLELFAPGDVTKPKKIEPLFLAFPQRQFILIGDSGEEDPEVYGEIARRFPQQVLHLWIRDVTQEPENAPRYLKAFKDIPRHRWQLFSHPETLQWE